MIKVHDVGQVWVLYKSKYEWKDLWYTYQLNVVSPAVGVVTIMTWQPLGLAQGSVLLSGGVG